MGFRNAAQREAAIEAARMQQAKKDCIDAVYASRQDFVRCEANDRAIIETIEYWTGNPNVLPTKFIFDEALLENPAQINSFARQPVERSRQQVIEEIVELLAAHSRR